VSTPNVTTNSPVERKCTFSGCDVVETTAKKLSKCSACKLVAYCSKEHQRADWANHKPFCLQNRVSAPAQPAASAAGSAASSGASAEATDDKKRTGVNVDIRFGNATPQVIDVMQAFLAYKVAKGRLPADWAKKANIFE
jgi:hypothetical protein